MPEKAPVCPWCDAPKDGVSINGIRILENCGNQYGTKQKANFCPLCGRPLTEEAAMKRFEPNATYRQVSKTLCGKENATVDEILAATKQVKQPTQKPLTMREIESEKAVWVENCFSKLFPAIYAYSNQYCAVFSVFDTFFDEPDCGEEDMPIELFGKEWRCWLRKPTDEERKAATV